MNKIKGGLVINFEAGKKDKIGRALNIQKEYVGVSNDYYNRYTQNIEIMEYNC